MANHPAILDTVDAKLIGLYNIIATKEAQRLLATGKCWQGLATHSTPPSDGVETPPNVGAKTPTDQPEPWPTAALAANRAAKVEVHVYDGPRGVGYVIYATVVVAGGIWQRAQNHGPETYRETDWTAKNL